MGDEIVALNDEDCRGVKSDEFKKLIVAAGRPFDLTVVRGGEGDDRTNTSAASSVASSKAAAPAASKAEKLAAEKRAIEEAKAKAKRAQEEKKAREEAEAAAAAKKKTGKKGKKEKKPRDPFAVGGEVWYDNGEDWVEATVLKAGDLFSVELRDSGERVDDVEKVLCAAPSGAATARSGPRSISQGQKCLLPSLLVGHVLELTQQVVFFFRLSIFASGLAGANGVRGR